MFRILWGPSSESIKRASLELLVMIQENLRMDPKGSETCRSFCLLKY